MQGSNTSDEFISSTAEKLAGTTSLQRTDIEAMLEAEIERLMREARVTSYVHIFASRNVAEAVRSHAQDFES